MYATAEKSPGGSLHFKKGIPSRQIIPNSPQFILQAFF